MKPPLSLCLVIPLVSACGGWWVIHMNAPSVTRSFPTVAANLDWAVVGAHQGFRFQQRWRRARRCHSH